MSEEMVQTGLDCLVTTPPPSKTEGEVMENRFVNGLQYFTHHELYNFVFKIADTQWPQSSITLGD